MDCFNVYIIIDSSSEKFTGKWMTKLPVLSGKRICTILELLSCIPRLCRTMIMWSLVHLAFWNFLPNLCTDNKNLLWIICFLTCFLLLLYWVFEKRGQREILVLVLGHVLVIISRLSCFLLNYLSNKTCMVPTSWRTRYSTWILNLCDLLHSSAQKPCEIHSFFQVILHNFSWYRRSLN